ncbi:MAG: hypothetical protein HC850_12390 [Rhodomicrobium sp.]|nr:hypothetical protein [Rhodomicrobium sp.]
MAQAAVLLLVAIGAPHRASAALDDDACNKLRTERQALMVLGIDKYFVKGAEWAKANLTVADLNLVKRYLDVYEQLKFRCEKIVAIAEPDELGGTGDDDGTASAGNARPCRSGVRARRIRWTRKSLPNRAGPRQRRKRARTQPMRRPSASGLRQLCQSVKIRTPDPDFSLLPGLTLAIGRKLRYIASNTW